jgi:hypothetical protein
MSWAVVLQIIIASCASNPSADQTKCRNERYICAKRAAVLNPKMEGADLVNQCLMDPKSFPAAAQSTPAKPVVSPSPSVK